MSISGIVEDADTEPVEILDAQGIPITQGCKIAYAVLYYKRAVLRIGTVLKVGCEDNGYGRVIVKVAVKVPELNRISVIQDPSRIVVLETD